jgi:hypothetical protein
VAPPANLHVNTQAGAATAGGVAPGVANQPGASNANPGGGISNSGGNLGGGAGGGGGGGGAFGFKDMGLTTPSNLDGADGTTGASGPDSSNDGMYSQGAGAGGAGSGYGNGNGTDWGSGGDGSGESVSVIDMNGMGGKNGAKGANGAIQDPADYFSRLSAKDNIFKVVERRYTKKSQQWVAEDLDKLRTKDLPTLKNSGGKPK